MSNIHVLLKACNTFCKYIVKYLFLLFWWLSSKYISIYTDSYRKFEYLVIVQS